MVSLCVKVAAPRKRSRLLAFVCLWDDFIIYYLLFPRLSGASVLGFKVGIFYIEPEKKDEGSTNFAIGIVAQTAALLRLPRAGPAAAAADHQAHPFHRTITTLRCVPMVAYYPSTCIAGVGHRVVVLLLVLLQHTGELWRTDYLYVVSSSTL